MTTPTLRELLLLFLYLFMETQCILALERVSRAQLRPHSARAAHHALDSNDWLRSAHRRPRTARRLRLRAQVSWRWQGILRTGSDRCACADKSGRLTHDKDT